MANLLETNKAVHGPLLRNTTRQQIWYGIGIWKTANGMSRINSNSNAKLIGTTTNKDKDGQVVTDKFPHTGSMDPEKSIRDWLNSGRFTLEDGM